MRCRPGDRKVPFTITCTDDGSAADLSSASSVKMVGTQGAEVLFTDLAPTVLAGAVTHAWADGETDVEGRVWGRVVVTWPGDLEQTFPPYGEVAFDIG